MENQNYKKFKKGMGIIVAIPGDEHDGKQNKRPGIIISSKPDYITVQLLSSRSSEYDFGSFFINNKTQYMRSIYLKNIPLNQIVSVWKSLQKREVIQLGIRNKAMNLIEKNCYKVKSITLGLEEYLDLKEKILQLEKENQLLKEKEKKQKYLQEQEFEYGYEE